MMRLPPFTYVAPTTAKEAVTVLAGEGDAARVVAGGTDLLPNMKRRQEQPATLVSLRGIEALHGIRWDRAGEVTIGAAEPLRGLERDRRLAEALPALHAAVKTISTPLLRNMGTIGGNVCLDTRCNYYDQTWEWRRAIDFCMKCEGEICWVAPSSPRCWAVNASDSVPVLLALGGRARLEGPDGEREIPLDDLFFDDGIRYLTKAQGEVLTTLVVPAQGDARSVYRKVRRRGSFDFPVLGVAVRLEMDGDRVSDARIVLNAVGSRPVWSREAMTWLQGRTLEEETIRRAADLAFKPAKPLDNTDHEHAWRKKMVKVEVRRALQALHDEFLGTHRPA